MSESKAVRPMSDAGIRDLVLRIRASGSDLGNGVEVVASGPARGVLDGGLSGPMPLYADSTMGAAAMQRHAVAEGRSFEAQYIQAGFMLASPRHTPERHQSQVESAKAAPTAELQAVLRRTGERRGQVEAQADEPRMRARAILDQPRNAAFVEEVFSKAPGVTDPAEKFERLVAAVRKMDFGRARFLSETRETNAPDGRVLAPAPSAPQDIKTTIAALGRGYRVLSDELMSRGVSPEVMMSGSGIGRQTVSATPRARGRMVREGMDID